MPKQPWQMTQAEYGEHYRAEYIASLEAKLKQAKKGALMTGAFTRYKSKADAVRKLTADIEQAKRDNPKGYTGNWLADVNQAMRLGKEIPPEVMKEHPDYKSESTDEAQWKIPAGGMFDRKDKYTYEMTLREFTDYARQLVKEWEKIVAGSSTDSNVAALNQWKEAAANPAKVHRDYVASHLKVVIPGYEREVFPPHIIKAYPDLFKGRLKGTNEATAEELFGTALPVTRGRMRKRVKLMRMESGASATTQESVSNHDVQNFAHQLKDEFGLQQLFLYIDVGGNLELHNIIVPKEKWKQGIGSAVISRIKEFADKHGLRITLSPGVRDDYHGTTSHGRLVRFYKKQGFVKNRGRKADYSISATMYREPINSEMVVSGDIPALSRTNATVVMSEPAGMPPAVRVKAPFPRCPKCGALLNNLNQCATCGWHNKVRESCYTVSKIREAAMVALPTYRDIGHNRTSTIWRLQGGRIMERPSVNATTGKESIHTDFEETYPLAGRIDHERKQISIRATGSNQNPNEKQIDYAANLLGKKYPDYEILVYADVFSDRGSKGRVWSPDDESAIDDARLASLIEFASRNSGGAVWYNSGAKTLWFVNGGKLIGEAWAGITRDAALKSKIGVVLMDRPPIDPGWKRLGEYEDPDIVTLRCNGHDTTPAEEVADKVKVGTHVKIFAGAGPAVAEFIVKTLKKQTRNRVQFPDAAPGTPGSLKELPDKKQLLVSISGLSSTGKDYKPFTFYGKAESVQESFTIDDVQLYYDTLVADQAHHKVWAIEKTKKKFGLKTLEVNPVGKVSSDDIEPEPVAQPFTPEPVAV